MNFLITQVTAKVTMYASIPAACDFEHTPIVLVFIVAFKKRHARPVKRVSLLQEHKHFVILHEMIAKVNNLCLNLSNSDFEGFMLP